MPADMPIGNDWKMWDWQHTITYKVRGAADSFATTVSSVKAVREDIENQLEDELGVKRAVWHVPNTFLSALAGPKAGDKITDADSADWHIDFADRDPSWHYWSFRTVKAVS